MRLSRMSGRFLLCLSIAASLWGWVLLRAQDAPGLACPPTPLPLFTATFDGAPLELHPFGTGSGAGSFGIFEVANPTVVVIRAGFDVRWVDVRPLSSRIVAEIAPNHREVLIPVTGATPLTVEFNDDLGHVVHLFPYAAGKETVKDHDPHVRYFSPGVHDAGVIELKSDEMVYLAPGAWVKGIIHARNARNVAILGHGVLDASESSDASGAKGRGAPYGGYSPIYLERTENARIEGVTIFNSHAWTVHLRQADGTRIDGIRILNPGPRYGDDGIDIDSSSHVVVENVFVRTNDDCVVVKNLADVDTGRIVVRHAVLWDMPSGGNGVEIGFENRSHPIDDVRIEDIDMIHVERGAAISIHAGDSGVVENVSYDGIRVEDVRRKLIDFAVVYGPYGPDKPRSEAEIRERLDRGGAWDGNLCYLNDEKAALASRRGHIRNITVKRLEVVSGALPYSVIAGYDAGHGIENVTIERLSYQGRLLQDAASADLVTEYASGVVVR